MSEELAKHLSFFVPPGFLLMKQTEIDRIHNESEARYIERNAARAEADRLRAAVESVVEVDETGDRCWLNPDLTPAVIAGTLTSALNQEQS